MMNRLTCFALLATAVCSSNGYYRETDEFAADLFSQWQKEHNIYYLNEEEEQAKFHIFKKNIAEINMLNRKFEGKTHFAVNQFADMSPEVFQSLVLMPRRPAPRFPPERYLHVGSKEPLPSSFDWTEKGAVTSVKNQGTVGTCWAFSTVGNIEGQLVLQGHPLTNLSVEQIVDCDGTQDQKQNRADCGVFGGWPYLAYQYVQKAGGLESWTDYKYCCGVGGGPGSCFPCKAPGFNKTLCGPPAPWCLKNESCAALLDKSKFVPGLKVVGWKAIDKDETVMAQSLMKVGPLSVALNARLLQFYHHGVFNPPKFLCDPKSLDHAVLIVGFGEEKVFFQTEAYWKVKNSWGPKWGQKGYFYITRGEGTCGINTQVTTAELAH